MLLGILRDYVAEHSLSWKTHLNCGWHVPWARVLVNKQEKVSRVQALKILCSLTSCNVGSSFRYDVPPKSTIPLSAKVNAFFLKLLLLGHFYHSSRKSNITLDLFLS